MCQETPPIPKVTTVTLTLNPQTLDNTRIMSCLFAVFVEVYPRTYIPGVTGSPRKRGSPPDGFPLRRRPVDLLCLSKKDFAVVHTLGRDIPQGAGEVNGLSRHKKS